MIQSTLGPKIMPDEEERLQGEPGWPGGGEVRPLLRVRPSTDPLTMTVAALARFLRRWGTFPIALVLGARRAGKSINLATILGGSLLGAVMALVLHAGFAASGALHLTNHLPGWRRMNLIDRVEIGAGIGAILGAILHLLNLTLEEHAREKQRKLLGDN